MGFSLMNINSRSLTIRLISLGAIFTCMFTLSTYASQSSFKFRFPGNAIFSQRKRSPCAPNAWANGQWQYRPHTNLTAMTKKEDALEFAGLEGCASDREFFWHLAADVREQWNRWPKVSSYGWKPADDCDIRPLDGSAMIKDMVEQGGWLLLGGTSEILELTFSSNTTSDSITEGHFFSISCILYPHVRATPNYTENPYFDRAWAQNLYLNPSSPLISTLSLPPNFSIKNTPLVTFRRVDLLFNKSELINLRRERYRPPQTFELFSEERFWSLSPKEYMPMFLAPLPEANYGTLVVSTGGHWTTTLLHGFRDESKKDSGYGIDGVIKFFDHAMRKWATDVQFALDADQRNRNNARHKQYRRVVVRAYLPGHEDCHKIFQPWTHWHKPKWDWFNWSWIKDFNTVFEVRVLPSPLYPRDSFTVLSEGPLNTCIPRHILSPHRQTSAPST